MSRFFRRFAVLMVGLGFSACGWAHNSLTPRETVEQYCELDAEGAIFSASESGFDGAAELLYDEDETSYDSAVIVSGISITGSRVLGNRASVEVTYTVLGIFGGDGVAESAPRRETVTFHVIRVGGKWKIDHLRQMPHISKSWILLHLKEPGAGTPEMVAAAKIEAW